MNLPNFHLYLPPPVEGEPVRMVGSGSVHAVMIGFFDFLSTSKQRIIRRPSRALSLNNSTPPNYFISKSTTSTPKIHNPLHIMCRYTQLQHILCGCKSYIVTRPCAKSKRNGYSCVFDPREVNFGKMDVTERCGFCHDVSEDEYFATYGREVQVLEQAVLRWKYQGGHSRSPGAGAP